MDMATSRFCDVQCWWGRIWLGGVDMTSKTLVSHFNFRHHPEDSEKHYTFWPGHAWICCVKLVVGTLCIEK